MNGEERRNQIVDILKHSSSPVPGTQLAQILDVSRQVIVQDVALIRAKNIDVFSTNRGYVLNDKQEYSRILKVKHEDDEVEAELGAIVDMGGWVRDVFVYHKVYGVIRAEMNIHSRRDIKNYLEDIASGKSSLLKNVTSGYHYHTIVADDEQTLETPVAFSDAGQLLFTADIMPSAEDAGFPSNGQFQQIYQIPVAGGRPVMFSSMPMECISINKEGAILYQDKKGYEDYWRKHQKSPIARDIWMLQPGQTPRYEKQTTFIGDDRGPVWAPDGKSFYYLSEENGSFNIYQRIPGSNASKQVTHHTQHPVRFLSMASNGNLCYGFDGEIYTLTPGGKSQKVSVKILPYTFTGRVSSIICFNRGYIIGDI